MAQNRLGGEIGPRHFYFGEGDVSAFPRPAQRAVAPSGFVACPMVGMVWPQMIYWMAMQQAREVVRPSWTERALSPQLN